MSKVWEMKHRESVTLNIFVYHQLCVRWVIIIGTLGFHLMQKLCIYINATTLTPRHTTIVTATAIDAIDTLSLYWKTFSSVWHNEFGFEIFSVCYVLNWPLVATISISSCCHCFFPCHSFRTSVEKNTQFHAEHLASQ